MSEEPRAAEAAVVVPTLVRDLKKGDLAWVAAVAGELPAWTSVYDVQCLGGPRLVVDYGAGNVRTYRPDHVVLKWLRPAPPD